MRGERYSKRTLRTSAMMAVIAVMISLFPLLLACSSEGSKDQPDGSRRTDEGQQAGTTRGGQTRDARAEDSRDRCEPQAALVPIAHLSSTVENVSMEELSGTRGLAVGRGYRDEAEGLIGSASFESFDSGDAVVDHVSKTPDALGLVPWNEVGPRIKALSVDNAPLLD